LAELSEADVLRILDLVDKSAFDYFQLTLGDLHLTVSKNGPPPTAAAGTATNAALAPSAGVEGAATAKPAQPSPPASPVSTAAPPAAPPAVATQPAAPVAAESGLIPVISPMVGTFYRAPSPEAPPFVEVGSAIDEDTTLALVEAMKVFTSVLAGVRGVVDQILVENAQFVEYGQPLFLVRPEAA
jgi:acetyl-CoA carboxylase biotin carboxyl carrier protein